jgi:hypothetical protein
MMRPVSELPALWVQQIREYECYAREFDQDPLVLTEGGHAIAALVPLDDEDLESLALSLSPKF